ncbi:MAG: peptide deformylase 1 [Acidimicrobiales bacterium]|nr:MAG: peptide deformylase 1 [Acidimicrobiales bacterium]
MAFVTASMSIRILGDPVLRQRATEVEEIDGKVAALCDRMLEVMYEAPGVGLAAPQVGVRKRIFVYDVGEGPAAVVNPEIVESDGEWTYEEGCLSVPGLSFEIVRPRRVHLRGWDAQGREVDIEADDLLARVFQHEIDHLDGVLLLDRLEEEERKAAMRRIRELELTGGLQAAGRDSAVSRGRRL